MTEHNPNPLVPDGSVVITPAQQYAELQLTRQAVERLTNTVDPALSEIRNDIHDVRDQMANQRVDIDANTRWRYMLTGALVLLSALVGYGLLNITTLNQ